MKNWLYRLLVNRTTNECYRNALGYFPSGSRILDVGIGNGIMIKTFHPLIQSKGLKITGIDIDPDYLRHCRKLVRRHGLEDHIEVHQGSVESYQPGETPCFDFVLFSMSFMLLDDQQSVLCRVKDWLKPGGEIVFVQAMFKRRSRLIDVIKPKLKYLTTVDFGMATYEADFSTLLSGSRLSVKEDRLLKGEWFHGQCRMIVASVPQEDRQPAGIQADTSR